jgi:hypothetical protein
MTFDKRIWKTAVLAAAITLVAGLVVMRMDDWSKGLNSGFVAHGQTGAGGTSTSLPCGSGATGTATACISKTLPHVVGGGGYASTIEIVNTGSVTASISAAFFNQDGTASTLTYATNLNGTNATFTGAMTSALSVPVNAILVITLANTGNAIVVNWGNITSTTTISVAEAFELRDLADNLLSRVGVPASAADMTSFVIPRFRNLISGLDVGFAVANTGSTDTVLVVTLRDAGGKTLATTQVPLRKHSQIAKFPNELFPNLQVADGTGYHALTFTAGGPQLAAVGLAIEGGSLATFPVDRLQ